MARSTGPGGRIVAVHRNELHEFSKVTRPEIELVAGHGVAGDAHGGATVQHRSRVARDPTRPNLRQVHLIASELLHELRVAGFVVAPGELGENVTTEGIDLLALPAGTHLRLGRHATLGLTGLRNPCAQIDAFREGLRSAVLERDADGHLVGRAGVMAVVLRGGTVRSGDPITTSLPGGPPRPLERV